MASFVGKKYKLDKSENFDEYMKELGKCSSRIKKHELESSKKCYVNWWQMPCKEVAKRREQRVWEKKPKTRHRKTTASRPAFFFFCAEVQKEKKR